MGNNTRQTRQDVRVNGAVRQVLRDVQQRCGYQSVEGRRAQKILASRQRVMPAHQLETFLGMLGA